MLLGFDGPQFRPAGAQQIHDLAELLIERCSLNVSAQRERDNQFVIRRLPHLGKAVQTVNERR